MENKECISYDLEQRTDIDVLVFKDSRCQRGVTSYKPKYILIILNNIFFYINFFHLLLSTLAMMGLTFLIGFFVAAVIKLIAYAADSFDFYSSHRLELLRLRRWRQHRQKVERLVRQIPIADEDALGDSREDYSRGIDRNFTGYSGYYHGVSPGASENNLVNYYYSQDTREFFLREEEQAHVNKKNSKKLTNNKQ